MARAPYDEGVPTVAPSGPSGNDYIHVDAGTGAFGGLQAAALQKSGDQLGTAGNNLAATADLIQQRYNQIAVDGAINQLQDQHYALTFGNPDAIFRLSGKDAMDKGPAVQQQIDQARKDLYAGLNNDYQRLQFDTASRRMQNITMSRVGEHITNQMHAYGTEVSKAMIFNAGRDAGADYDNEDTFNASIQRAQEGAARLTINSGNATDPEISRMNRTNAVNQVVTDRFDGLYSADPIKAGNWLLNGKAADGTPVRDLVSGPAGDRLIERAQNAQDKGFVDGLFQKYLGGPSPGGAAPPSRGGTPFTPKALPAGVSLDEDAMVRTVAGEAGAEPLMGQQAVAAVIKNRAEGSGMTPRDVVFAPNQFEPWNGGAARQRLEQMDPASPQYQSILNNVVRPIMAGQAADPTGGARYFYAPALQASLGRDTPSFATGTPVIIGRHNFYKGEYAPAGDANAPVTIPPTGPAAPMGGAVVQPISTAAAPAPALAAMPDESAMVNDVLHAYPPGPRRDKLVADVRSQMSILRASIATDARDFVKTLPDLQSSLLAGNSRPIPEDMIRHFLPPADAAREIENLHIAQTAGQEFRAVKWGTPQDVQAAGNRLLAELGMPGARSIEDMPAPVVDENSDEAFRFRASILQRFQEAIKARKAALDSNAAEYVSSNPLVMQKAQAVAADPTNPDKAKDYWNTMLSVQARLGVAPDKQHVMTKGYAEGEVSKLLNADPATNDAAAQLAGMANNFGDMWPKAYHDLVSLGNLPDGYRTLAEIPSATVRWDYNQMLRLTKEKGGVDKWIGGDSQSGGGSNIRQINAAIDEKMADFSRTMRVPGVFGDDALYLRVKDSVRNLAAYYALGGDSASKALDKAYDGIIGQKYDMAGQLRVPKGPNGEHRLGVVEAYGNDLLTGLKPQDLSPLQGRAPVGQATFNNLSVADRVLRLTPEEKNLYQIHLAHLNGDDGGVVRQPNGETSTLLQTSAEHGGRFYNVPTIWGGKEHTEDEAGRHAGEIGWDKWPSYATRGEAEERYMEMHTYIERDIAQGAGARRATDELDAQRQAEILAQAQRTGRWVTNPMDDGAYLVGQDRAGVMYAVRRANGSLVEMKFKDAPHTPGMARAWADAPPVTQ